jgi:hypothetical protein
VSSAQPGEHGRQARLAPLPRLAALAFALVSLLAAPTLDAAPRVGIVDQGERVHGSLSKGRLRPERSVRLETLRGEHVAFQIVVETDTPLERLELGPGELSGPEGARLVGRRLRRAFRRGRGPLSQRSPRRLAGLHRARAPLGRFDPRPRARRARAARARAVLGRSERSRPCRRTACVLARGLRARRRAPGQLPHAGRGPSLRRRAR